MRKNEQKTRRSSTLTPHHIRNRSPIHLSLLISEHSNHSVACFPLSLPPITENVRWQTHITHSGTLIKAIRLIYLESTEQQTKKTMKIERHLVNRESFTCFVFWELLCFSSKSEKQQKNSIMFDDIIIFTEKVHGDFCFVFVWLFVKRFFFYDERLLSALVTQFDRIVKCHRMIGKDLKSIHTYLLLSSDEDFFPCIITF